MELEQIIFQETTTIGIRRIAMERTILKRETISVKLAFGELDVKKCTMSDGQTKYYPEYESAVRLAKQSGRPLGQILDELKRSI